ncbi:hypothetical protein PSTT_04091 [Puccinia striiformis]|uniref:Uncharacterized protein n=1 Tax=Puccinia striiformis TaxID=27350 RepID=A0A2S4VTJ9_9BASI|nr:hypothetical protein PSTT_04091 [Puccinia striiformis]
MTEWFLAEAQRVIIATKTKTYQLGYKLQEGGGTGPDGLDLDTPDVLKRRFTAAPRFATGLIDDMYYHDQKEEDGEADDSLQPIGGAWLDKNLVEPLLARWTGDGHTLTTINGGDQCWTAVCASDILSMYYQWRRRKPDAN